MKKCQHCGILLLKDARFCHNCGKEAGDKIVNCPKCGSSNPATSKFCYSCGQPIAAIYTANDLTTPVYGLNFAEIQNLPSQLSEAFMIAISVAVEADGEFDKESLYLEAFNSSGFYESIFEEQMLILTRHLEALYKEHGTQAFMAIEVQIYAIFQRLLERFFIQYTQHLLPFHLPERILAYETASLQSANLHTMMIAYLALEEEGETFYLNAVDIPLKKIKSARKSFFKHNAGEVPYIFIDQTVFGSGKEGMILTNKAIYWKAYFHKAASMNYNDLQTLKRTNNHLEINGVYLNITPAINYRLHKLLQRLKRMFDIIKL